jgi:hypothetical protein
MGKRSNYADTDRPEGIDAREHKLFPAEYRAYTPADGEARGIHGRLAADSTGDWSWKPLRDRITGDQLVTFRGSPPGAAEASRRK